MLFGVLTCQHYRPHIPFNVSFFDHNPPYHKFQLFFGRVRWKMVAPWLSMEVVRSFWVRLIVFYNSQARDFVLALRLVNRGFKLKKFQKFFLFYSPWNEKHHGTPVVNKDGGWFLFKCFIFLNDEIIIV